MYTAIFKNLLHGLHKHTEILVLMRIDKYESLINRRIEVNALTTVYCVTPIQPISFTFHKFTW